MNAHNGDVPNALKTSECEGYQVSILDKDYAGRLGYMYHSKYCYGLIF